MQARKTFQHQMLFWAIFVAAFFGISTQDLAISQYLTAQPLQLLTLFAAEIGPLLGIWIGGYCAGMLSISYENWYKILFGVLTVVISGFGGWHYMTYSQSHSLLVFLLVTILFLCSICFAMFSSKSIKGKQRKYYLLGVLLLGLESGTVELLKNFWGRPRFYTLADPSAFVPWYIISGGGSIDAMKSFPSGHTGAVSVTLWLTLLPDLLPKLEKKRPWIIAGVALWISATALGRISGGFHFASDVMFGFLITYTYFLLLEKWLKIVEEPTVEKTDE